MFYGQKHELAGQLRDFLWLCQYVYFGPTCQKIYDFVCKIMSAPQFVYDPGGLIRGGDLKN